MASELLPTQLLLMATLAHSGTLTETHWRMERLAARATVALWHTYLVQYQGTAAALFHHHAQLFWREELGPVMGTCSQQRTSCMRPLCEKKIEKKMKPFL